LAERLQLSSSISLMVLYIDGWTDSMNKLQSTCEPVSQLHCVTSNLLQEFTQNEKVNWLHSERNTLWGLESSRS
jgi:hypothetical protein